MRQTSTRIQISKYNSKFISGSLFSGKRIYDLALALRYDYLLGYDVML